MRRGTKWDMVRELRLCWKHADSVRRKQQRCISDCPGLSLEDVLRMYERQGGACAVSGIPFDASTDYLRPSVDAKDPSAGHGADNCHLVLAVVNYAKNKLTLPEFARVMCGDCSVAYDRPNRGRAHVPGRALVDPARPLAMTPRQAYLWDALVAVAADEGAATEERVRERVNSTLDPPAPLAPHEARCGLLRLVEDGYVVRTGDGRLAPAPAPLPHPSVTCSCGEVVEVDSLRARRSRSESFAHPDPLATNQYVACCRACRTRWATSCRNRDRATYVWSKVRSRLRGRKSGDLTKEALRALCGEEVCRVTGLPLLYRSGLTANQASVDRIDNAVGYRKDNVRIVSLLANYARAGTSIDDGELRRVLDGCRRRVPLWEGS